MLVGVGVDGSDGVSWVALAVNGISCGIRFSPSFVTWTGASCPLIERTTS